MPVYEYVCSICKNKFELMRPFSRSSEGSDCPRCHKKAERILSSCYSKTVNEYGATPHIGGGSSCSSCSSSNCSSCNH